MSEYTPTTEQVRDLWVDGLFEGIAGDEAIEDAAWDPDRRAAQFDRWLAAHDAERAVSVPQSVPSDAQVIAALNAYWEYDPPVTDVGYWSEKHVGIMRAALRASGAVKL